MPPIGEDLSLAREPLSMLMYGKEGSAKGFVPETRVATPGGWRAIGDLRIGDEVIGSDGLPHFVTEVVDRGIKPIYTFITSDGVQVTCDSEHLWAVRDWRKRACRDTRKELIIRSTAELASEPLHKADKRAKGLGTATFQLPMVQAVEYPKLDLLIEPYLLGVLLANGSLSAGAVISTLDEDVIANLRERNPDVIIEEKAPSSSCRRWSAKYLSGAILRDRLRVLNLWELTSHSKYIPEDYLTASVEQRLDLLRGLLDSDGSCSARTNRAGAVIKYQSRSEALAKGVAELVRSLGGNAAIRPKESREQDLNGYHYEAGSAVDYLVSIHVPTSLTPFATERKVKVYRAGLSVTQRPTRSIRSIEPAGHGRTVCIAIDSPDHLYVVEGYLVTHNTTGALMLSKRGRVVLINAEGGAKPTALRARGIVVENIETWPKEGDVDHITFDTIEEEVFIPLKIALEADPDAYVGVVIDSFSELSRRLVDKAAAAGRQAEIAKGKTPRGQFTIDLDDWGTMTTMMRLILRRFRDLGIHLIITALERRDIDKNSGDVTYGPAVGPAIGGDTMGMVDVVVWTQLEQIGPDGVEFYTGTTRAREMHRAKDRFGVLPARMVEPSADRVLDYIEGKLTTKTDERHLAAATEARKAPAGD